MAETLSPFVKNDVSPEKSTIRGDKDLLENFQKTYQRTASKRTLTGKFTGKWSDCIKFQNTYHPGYQIETGYFVTGTTSTRREGGVWGEVAITADWGDDSGSTAEKQQLTELGKPVWGLQNEEVTQPLHFHPQFPNKNMSVSTMTGMITMNSVKIWLCYINSPAYVQAIGSFRIDPNNEDSVYCPVPDELKDWKDLYDKGRETWVLYMPVITKTTQYSGTPDLLHNTVFKNIDDLGHIAKPADAPQGWDQLASSWLKTQDDVSWDGASRFTRTEKWNGSAEWPAIIYTNPLKKEE